MKIIITESQYNLIIEREDEKNVMEMNAIYRLFIAKFNARDFHQSSNGYETAISMKLNTDFGDLLLNFTNEKHADRGHYIWNTNGRLPMISIYNCDFVFEGKRVVNIRKFNSQVLKHEMVHFIDDKKDRKLTKSRTGLSRDRWNNDPFEINAEFLSVMDRIPKRKPDYVLPDTFEQFLKSYKGFSLTTFHQFENMDEKKRKALIGRLYQYYTHLRDKLQNPST